MSSIRLLNAPWRPLRMLSSWRIYDQDGTAVAKLAASEGPASDRLAYIARLVAKAPELELTLAECAAMLGVAADALEHMERASSLKPNAGAIMRAKARDCVELLHAIAAIPKEPT